MSRREDLDWVRTVSAFGVVLLHASSLFVARPSRLALLGVTPALLCNQAVRFAVPVFFMLSGMGPGLSGKPPELPGFWLRRLRRIGVPYALWSLFYFLLDRRFAPGALLSSGGLRAFGRLLLTGGAASHLWFLPVLLQLTLLYPGLKRLMDRFPALTLPALFLLSMACTLILYVPLPFTGWWRPRLWRLFPTWVFYFALGMALTEKRLDRLLRPRRGRTLLPALAAAAALVYAWDAGRSGNLESIKPQLFLYSPLCFLALAASWERLRRFARLRALSAFAARHSMTVYLSHVFFLRLLRRRSFFNRNTPAMLLTFAAVAALSLLTALLPAWYGRLRKRRKGRPAP